MDLTGVLVGGPFDGAEAKLVYAPQAVGVYECDRSCGSEKCPWKDRLHWTDWGGGRKPGTEKYVLQARERGRVSYVYGFRGDPDHGLPDYIAEELAATKKHLEVLADCLTA